MTWNFAMQAIDQIVNHAAKQLYMSAGDINVPIVFRGPNGAAAGVGAQHSQDFAAWYMSVPGLKVLSPYSAEDARGLMKAAIRDDNPVCVLENELLYGTPFPISPEALGKDFTVPFGKLKVERAGTDVSIITFSRMVGSALAAAELLAAQGVSAEVVNLRSLRPLDKEGILASVRKTHRCVTLEEGWHTCGVGAEISAIINEEAFDDMDAPVERVTGSDTPMPYAINLEKTALPQVADTVNAALRTMYRKK
jgi:pyruvate dehydrogenase E1 component beta subunit